MRPSVTIVDYEAGNLRSVQRACRNGSISWRARIAGRGAWLHPDPACLDLAEKRRALPRALRVPAPLDTSAVRTEIERLAAHPR